MEVYLRSHNFLARKASLQFTADHHFSFARFCRCSAVRVVVSPISVEPLLSRRNPRAVKYLLERMG